MMLSTSENPPVPTFDAATENLLTEVADTLHKEFDVVVILVSRSTDTRSRGWAKVRGNWFGALGLARQFDNDDRLRQLTLYGGE